MKRCPKCKNIFNDVPNQCPDCGIALYDYSSEDQEKDRQERLKNKRKHIMFISSLIIGFIITFLLGFSLKSCTGIQTEDYNNLKKQNQELKSQNKSLSAANDSLTKEYNAYKSKMQPYEEQNAEKQKATINEQNNKASENETKIPETKTIDNQQTEKTSSSSYENSEADTKRLMQLYLDDFKNKYPNTILKVEAYSDKVFNIWFSNDWYILNDQEKESFANNFYTLIRNRYIEVSGKSDGLMSLTFYDQNSKILAKSKLLGGIELK